MLNDINKGWCFKNSRDAMDAMDAMDAIPIGE